MQTFKQSIITIIICLVILAGINLVYSWTGPPYQGVCNDPPCPPGGNVPAPINVGGTAQTFLGSKTLNVKSDGTGSLGINGALTVGGLGIFNSNVGIGTAGPYGKLQIVTSDDTTPSTVNTWDSRYLVVGAAGSGSGSGAMTFSYSTTNNYGVIQAIKPNVAWGNLVLQSGGGNVGIGTTNPGSNKLSVAGNIYSSTNVCIPGKCLSSVGGGVLVWMGFSGWVGEGNMGGVAGLNPKCNATYPGSRVATYNDYILLGNSPPATTAVWVPGSPSADESCRGWTSNWTGGDTGLLRNNTGNFVIVSCDVVGPGYRLGCVQ